MARKRPRPRYALLRDAAVGLAGVGTATALVSIAGHLSPYNAGLVYLLAVATVAAMGGTRPAVVATVLSFLAWDFFFLEPRYTLLLDAWHDWLLLLTWLLIAILVGQMTGRLRAREGEARLRERDTAALYSASQAVSAQMDLERALPALTEQIVAHTDARACAVLGIEDEGRAVVHARAGAFAADDGARLAPLVAWVCRQARAVGLTGTQEGWPASAPAGAIDPRFTDSDELLLPLSTRDGVLGVLYAAPPAGEHFIESDCRLLVAFASQAAAVAERYRLLREAAALAAQKESEQLRVVLYSSLSHNLKTPLASLSATLSSLRCDDVEWERAQVRESLDYMAEDVGRLTEQIDNLLSLSQLETGNWTPQPEWIEVPELIDVALRPLPPAEAARVEVDTASGMVSVDAVQMAQVVRHLVENACAYSPHETRIRVSGRVSEDSLEICVDDAGPGIAPDERERVFRKFYRGAAARRARGGTGLGLAICSEIVRAHGGTITAETSPAGGARLHVRVPLERKPAA